MIASTDAAVDEGRNTFTSAGGLTVEDIQNTASYEGSSSGISVGTGVSATTAGMNGLGVGIGSDSGNASSTTRRAPVEWLVMRASGAWILWLFILRYCQNQVV